ncbi:MAG: BA14K family protein [Caldilineaceae bacterium]|nr:BA14K family protein [Caldilineaceae bacterium]
MGLKSRALAAVTALACSMGAASAAPAVPASATAAPSPLIKVEHGDPQGFTLHKFNRLKRQGPWNAPFNGQGYGAGVYVAPVVIPRYRGYRGVPRYRSGYRRHVNGWWYPLAAFGVQVIIRDPQPYRRAAGNLPPEHYVWCDRRYKSYRTWDDTFQPYHGPRRICNSPYDGR